MMKVVFFVALHLACIGVPRLQGQCYQFTEEHVDLLSIMWNSESNTLSLMASDDTHGGVLYASNQCVVIAPASSRFTLPSGTPFGNEGDPLWILPQNPYAGMPYVGVSAERLPPGTFNNPLSIRLTRVEGPGDFILWQSSSFGSFDVKMDSRDGINAGDQITPSVGSHEHFNWGFTTSGVYRVYFEAAGVRTGHTTNTLSPETPFTFHVLPLRPFESWIATNWPCECATNIIAPGADPDGDGIANALEYAIGNNPHQALYSDVPELIFVTVDGTEYSALRYTRATNATDVAFEVHALVNLRGQSEILTNVISLVPQDLREVVTVRDTNPKSGFTNRFFELRVQIDSP